jgi:hypothetical protein
MGHAGDQTDMIILLTGLLPSSPLYFPDLLAYSLYQLF